MKIVTIKNYIIKSFLHYRKINITLILSIIVTSTVITGSLILGDSIRRSLKECVYEKIGRIQWSLYTGERFIRSSLARRMEEIAGTNVAPVMILKGIVSYKGGKVRANSVQVAGVDNRFFKLSLNEQTVNIPPGMALINQKLARKLNLKKNDEFTISIRRPDVLPTDSPFSTGNDYIGFRLIVQNIIDKENFGDFSLNINPVTTPGIFVSLGYLADKMELKGKANTLLVSENSGLTSDDITQVFNASWELQDAGFEIKDIPGKDVFELRSQRVFLSNNIVEIIMGIYPAADYIFSYFVNAIRNNKRTTPYSIVSAPPPIQKKINEDEIIINTWLAEDLNANKGDLLELDFYIINQQRKLQLKKSNFTVRSIIPIKDKAADKTLMPDYPGLSDAGECRDWKPGIPIDLDKIRKKDEQYWDTYRGTPKAFINLKKARKIWGNQFGSITGIRFKNADKQKIIENLNKHLYPEKFGFVFEDIRKLQIESSEESVDFAQLFMGLSFFVIISSLILIGLFFIFYIQNRSSEIGTLFSLGYKKKMIYRIFLSEGVLIAALGSLLGIVVSIIYNHAFLYFLGSLWYDAVRTKTLNVYIEPLTIFKGFILSTVFAVSSMYLSLRSLLKKNIYSIQTRIGNTAFFKKDISFIYMLFCIGLPVFIVLVFIYAVFIIGNYPPILFFFSGILLLIEGLLIVIIIFKKLQFAKQTKFLSAKSIGIRNINRNPGRSLSVVGLLSIGIFMVISVSSNRSNYLEDTSKRNSGTGGFSLFCRTTYPVNQDLNSVAARKKTSLNKRLYNQIKFVLMRLREGDDASCLNPNRTFLPQILGVNVEEFADREAFTFSRILDEFKKKGINESGDIWPLLELALPDGSIPAIADQTVIQWGLGKSLGDSITVLDEKGNKVELKLIAGLANSIFQGYIIISEKHFLQLFPSVSGFNVFLVDRTENNKEDIINDISRAFLSHGIEVADTVQKLSDFNSVQNTYLSIFLVLGGFGLLLGTIGLGVLILRNVLERKGEIALLKALGFTKKFILRILIYEYIFLLLLGILIGSASGTLAVLPVLLTPGTQVPYLLLFFTIFFIASTGALSIYFTGLHAVKGTLLDDLREE